MRIRPFLSHKRENAQAVSRLKQTLQVYGAGGWKDTDDLRFGASTEGEIRRVIAEDVGGFLWWGTRPALESWMINKVEIPAAVERASNEPLFPLVPVFIDLKPGQNREDIVSVIGDYAEDLLDRNGTVRGTSESAEAFRKSVARRYVRDAVRSLPDGPLDVAFRTLSEPAGEHSLTFDWRPVFDASTRHLDNGSLSVLVDALTNAKEALQGRERDPEVRLDLDLPLPLAVLVGHEWRVTSRIRLQIMQRTGSTCTWVNAAGSTEAMPEPGVEVYDRLGPAVLAVSCGGSFDKVAKRYAAEQNASRLVSLHAPGLLNARQMRAMARKAAGCLQDINAHGLHKHLLIKGPVSMAVMIGAASNASGPVTLPFWDGSKYVSHITVAS